MKKKKEKISLHPRKKDISFYHKNSEVSYDPTNKFYRSTFTFEFEKEAYEFIDTFVDLVCSDERMKEYGAMPADKNMTGFYFDIISHFPSVRWEDFSKWYYSRKEKLQTEIRGIIVNTLKQQNLLKIKDLEFLCWVSVSSFLSLITEEYFHKHFEQLNIMKDNLMNLLGSIFEIILREIYDDRDLDGIRNEKTGEDKRKIEPLLNRYVIVFNDIGDRSHVEKLIFQKDVRVNIDRQVMNKLTSMFNEVVRKSKRVEKQGSIRSILSDKAMIKVILFGKKDRRYFSKIFMKDKELKERMTAVYEREKIRELICEVISESGSSPLLNFIKQGGLIEEVLFENKTRKYLIKTLKDIGNSKSRNLMRYVVEAADRVKRSKNSIFNTVSMKSMERVLNKNLENISGYFRMINDFHEVRQKYGKKSSYSEELTGVKVIRQSVMKMVLNEETEMEKMSCVEVRDDEKTRIENNFEEGTLFYFRNEGPVYPMQEGGRRGKKMFLFADLRNSTETTMKLTKDTASFLTPYLNTVYKVSKNNNGTEIYFAGDGYAAHFSKVTDCIRTCYQIHHEFAKLRKDAESKIKAKEKEIFRQLHENGLVDKEGKLNKKSETNENYSEELKDFVKIVFNDPNEKVEDSVRRVAEEYSMPRVEIGIGVTEGELFFAVVGEESVKFNIVLSPSLTQAARLSGSNGEVQSYLEKKYGIKNIPRRVYVYEKKMFNQGVVITSDVFKALRKEVEIELVGKEEMELSYDVYFYYDKVLDKYMTLSKLEQGVWLKGIEHLVDVFEVFTSVTKVDSYINNWIKENKK